MHACRDLGNLLGTMLVYKLCAPLLKRLPVESLIRRLFLLEPNIVFNCFFVVINYFYMAIASGAIGLFRCYLHPDGQRSLQMAPEIICGSKEWNSVLIVGLIGALVLCLGPFVLFIHILVIAHIRFGEIGFQKRRSFLLSKFQLNRWWSN